MFRKKIKTKVHFIGIGGIGMSGIAEILLKMGHDVSGSDAMEGPTTARLKSLGAIIYSGHKGEHIHDPSVVVYSSAIKENNPEMMKAKEKGIPLIKRAEMLAELMRLKYGIAIAGTHGKTTTTSMLATILDTAKRDCTFVIGGIVEKLGGHAGLGKSEFLLAEADESDGTFLLLSPVLSVITNIDNDHLDYYQNVENLYDSFLQFANKVPFYGKCALNYHDKNLRTIKSKMIKPSVTFGIESRLLSDEEKNEVNYLAKNISYNERLGVVSFDLKFEKDLVEEGFKLNVPGEHNILNALGAIAMAVELEIPMAEIKLGLKNYFGVGRRIETVFKDDTIEIIDDYGHHPTEIEAVLKALKETRRDAKIITVFEPHRYSRTKLLWNEFLHCFNLSDELYLCPIYAASEKELLGISSDRLFEDVKMLHPSLAKGILSHDEFSSFLVEKMTNTKGKKVIVFLGAGSIGKKMREAVNYVSSQK